MFRVVALTAHSDSAGLAELARFYRPEVVAISDAQYAEDLRTRLADLPVELLAGDEGLILAAERPADFTMAAIVGFAGLAPTLAAVRLGGHLGLANKECLVAAGDLFTAEAKRHGTVILPVDSEHNAAFQLLRGQAFEDIERLTLTASGGPFRGWGEGELKRVTPEQAISHPIWSMGPKISVDSATLMNKGLELIEAYHLFSLPSNMLDVIVHPQSVVHAMLTLRDGSVYSHQAPPDMRGPIAYCLGWPHRIIPDIPRLDLVSVGKLEFHAPDRNLFKCLSLAEHALHVGGVAPTVLNAANEVAVAAFLAGNIGFLDIATLVGECLDQWDRDHGMAGSFTGLEEVVALDESVRDLAGRIMADRY